MKTYTLPTIAALVVCITSSGCRLLGNQGQAAPPEEPWRALHVLSNVDDDELGELARQLPALAEAGINVLILDVNDRFEFPSHPELRQGSRQITREGAGRLAAVARANGIRLIPQFQCLGQQSWAKQTFPS